MDYFLWPPNWGKPVNEEYSYLTDVQQSIDGTEVRRALRIKPRHTLTYEVYAQGIDAVRLRNFVRKNQGEEVGVPWWVSGVKWASTNPLRLNVMTEYGVMPEDLMFKGGADSVYLVNGGASRISSSTGPADGVSLLLTSGQELPGGLMTGASAYPVLTCVMRASQSLTNLSGDIISGTVSFEISEDLKYISAAPPVHVGTSYYSNTPNKVSDTTEEYIKYLNEIDYATGIKARFKYSDYTFRSTAHEYIYHKHVNVAELRSYLHWLKGRSAEVLIPSFTCDFFNPIFTGRIVARDLEFDEAGYSDLGEEIGLVKFDLINTSSGVTSFQIRDVGAPSLVGGGREAAPVGGGSFSIGASLVGASRVYLSRLASDTINIEWRSSEVAVVRLPYISLKR